MKHLARASLLLFSTCLLTSCGNTVKYEDCPDKYVSTMEFTDGFVIVQLTDVHWSTGTDAVASKAYMNNLLKQIKDKYGKIDLIEFTGDEFMLSNADTVIDFLSWAESLNIPYATTWGNHDIEGTYNPNWLSQQFMAAEHSLYKEVDNDDVHGRSNYIINLTDENGYIVYWQLAHLDSGASLTDSAVSLTRTYDYIREDQANWWKYEHDLINDKRETGLSDVPTIAYFHIAQNETNTAWEQVQAQIANGEATNYNKYYRLESFASSKLKEATANEISPFFKVARNNGLVAEFMGHCHANDWTVDYGGVTIGCGVKSNIELYYGSIDATESEQGFDLLGASVVQLHERGHFDLSHLYYNEINNVGWAKWVNYR